jgi:hypothetical protein
MVIAPCSVKTAGAIAACYSDSLIARAADVTLKEGRPLILLFRETPLHIGHLKCLLALAEMGAVILPPMPAFYHRPKDVDDVVNHTVARVLDRLGLPQTLVAEWRAHARSRRLEHCPYLTRRSSCPSTPLSAPPSRHTSLHHGPPRSHRYPIEARSVVHRDERRPSP